MGAKRQSNRIDAVRDAVTGYAVIVLGLICFIIVLVIVMASVRLVVGFSRTQSTAANAAATQSTTLSVPSNAAWGSMDPAAYHRPSITGAEITDLPYTRETA